MYKYRVYKLNRLGHVDRPADIIEAVSDEAAVECAKSLADGNWCEVWLEGARIAELNAPACKPIAPSAVQSRY